MPKKQIASWIKKRRGWSKRFRHPDGKTEVLQASARQLSRGWAKNWRGIELSLEPQEITSETKEGSTEAANRWAEYVQAVVDGIAGKGESEIDRLKAHIAELEAEIEVMGDPEDQNRETVKEIASEIRARRYAEQQGIDFDEYRRKKREAADLLQPHNTEAGWEIERRLYLGELDREPEPAEKHLTYWRDKYLALKKSDSHKSIGRYDNLQRNVKAFVSHVGETANVENVDEAAWEKWFLKVRSTGSTYTQRDLLSDTRGFAKYLYEQRQIELPRNLLSLKISTEATTIEHYTLEELQAILQKAPGFLQCVVYLAANCGFYQGDIATLTPDMLKGGYITRQRSKKSTTKGKNIPKVSWLLWDRTKELVEEHRTDRNGLLLTQPSGKPWKVEDQKPDGRISKYDAIRPLWKDFADAHKIRLGIKHIRKTAANLLSESEADRSNKISLQVKFLGQTPSGTAMKHYIDPTQEELDRAIRKLGDTLKA